MSTNEPIPAAGRPVALPASAGAGALGGAMRLGLILALHAGMFFVLQSGLSQAPSQQVANEPKTVFVSFVAPEPVPPPPVPPKEPPKPRPPEPKPPEPKPEPKPKPVKEPVKKVEKPAPVPLPPSENAPVAPPAPPKPPAPAETAPPPPAAAPAPAAAAAPAAPAPAPRPAQPRTVSSGIAYLQAPQPEYPRMSRRMREEGTAVLRVLVNERGRPERAEVQTSSGSERLDEAARRAVLRAVFKPHIEDGRPVPVFAIIPIRFQLDS